MTHKVKEHRFKIAETVFNQSWEKLPVIHAQQWLMVGLDEAHGGRKANRTHAIYRKLVHQSKAVVTMTATPVQQSPKVSTIQLFNNENKFTIDLTTS